MRRIVSPLDGVQSPIGRRVSGSGPAAILLGDEWNGMAIDFTVNAYIVQTASSAEMLFGGTPATQEPFAMATDFLTNSYAVRA